MLALDNLCYEEEREQTGLGNTKIGVRLTPGHLHRSLPRCVRSSTARGTATKASCLQQIHVILSITQPDVHPIVTNLGFGVILRCP
jgi:hypothetical protein